MSIPVFMSEIRAASTWFVQSGAGSVQAVPATQYYFLSTSKTSSGNGRSFLNILGTLLTTSSGSVTWTVTLDANLHVKFAHNSGSAQNLTLDSPLAYALGGGTVPGAAGSASFPGVPGSGLTLSFRPFFLWCPEMLISNVGPQLFDPMTQTGVRQSPGAAARAPDSTASFVDNGVNTVAVIMFNGVQYYRRAKPTNTNTGNTGALSSGWLQEDYETFWANGPRLGRRIIMWRDRAALVGQSAPFSTNGALNYVEYYPDAATRAAPDIKATSPVNLGWWDIAIGLWLTERGEQVY